MSRYIELAHRSFAGEIAGATLSDVLSGEAQSIQDDQPKSPEVPRIGSLGSKTFVLKLRNATTRMWGDQVEISAGSAIEAAESLAGEHLVEGVGNRTHLRVRVWPTPFGSSPCKLFYVPALA